MSGECTITIWVQKEHCEQAKAIFKEAEDDIDDEGQNTPEDILYYFQFYDRKAKHLEQACDALEAAGIAYDIDIGREHENDSRMTDTCRFTSEGQMVQLHWMEEDENLSLNDLMKHVDNYENLRYLIVNAKRDITPLPWDHQIEYGKRYVARQLIAPTQEETTE